MDHASRRRFLQLLAATGAGFTGLGRAAVAGGLGFRTSGDTALVPDPGGIIDLPEGFTYRVLSRWGEEMDDGLLVPGLHDGMACFDGGDGRLVLVRNHEIGIDADPRLGAFGPELERLDRIDPAMLFDAGRGGPPALGGTTTIVYDPESGEVVRHFLSLAGSGRNCAGGPTPWNTWVTCEEWTQRADDRCAVDHGWCFEVPASSRINLAPPRPIPAMGRFNHEAIAVSPNGRAVYLTEDRNDGVLYRYLPTEPGRLAAGGRLQALRVKGRPSLDTRNWIDLATESRAIERHEPLTVEWFDLEDPEAPEDDLRFRAFDAGAARFARGEGIWTGTDEVYAACTTGGPARIGQIFRYRPSPHEGTDAERDAPATIELFVEADEGGIIENCDNLTVAPWGELFVAEDGPPGNGLVRITADGEVTRFAMNRLSGSELAGVCFSPDGRTLFVNIQQQGLTLAITGPFRPA